MERRLDVPRRGAQPPGPPSLHRRIGSPGMRGLGGQVLVSATVAKRLRELIPIVTACVVWGKNWRNHSLLAHCNNQVAVEVVNAGYSRDADLMQLLWTCSSIRATCMGIHLRAVHILGVDNTGVDAISRDNLILFHFQVPEARPSPTPLPQALINLVVRQTPDWTSLSWSRLFGTSLRLI